MNYRSIGFKSWIPPEVVWFESASAIMVAIPVSDDDLVEFLALGKIEIDLFSGLNETKNSSFKRLFGYSELNTKLGTGLYHLLRKPDLEACNDDSIKKTVFLKTACILQDLDTVVVVASLEEGDAIPPELSTTLKEEAEKLYQKYKHELAEYNEQEAKAKEQSEALRAKFPEKNFPEPPRPYPPKVYADDLWPYFPKAVCFSLGRKTNHDTILKEALKHTASSGWSAPREAEYTAIICSNENQERHCLLSWAPYDGLPAYPEIRWAVQRSLPSAMTKPRMSGSDSPTIQPSERKRLIFSLEEIAGAEKTFPETIPDDTGDDARTSSIKESINDRGFEAIAWYQPFHTWTEDSWGIYFDATQLDQLATLLFEELRPKRYAHFTYGVCCQLAMGLVYSHELLHARVESCLSWLELNASIPKYLRYKRNVYEGLKGTKDWLEEALANWTSWEWYQSFISEHLSLNDQQSKVLNEVIEDVLDLSPEGYNKWRIGESKGSWRLFANQMAKGKPSISAKNLPPLEGILSDHPPYDFRTEDIPTYFIGEGVILNSLEIIPGGFSVPSRKEMMKALKYFGYECHKDKGKGSHEKWVAPKKPPFPLPKKDPVSIGVFHSFLRHLSLTKNQYAEEIRPCL